MRVDERTSFAATPHRTGPVNAESRVREHSRPWRWIPYLVLAASLLLTGVAAYLAARLMEARDKIRFETNIRYIEEAIYNRMSLYVEALIAGSGLFAAHETVTREVFRTYLDRLRLPERYPGIQGIGFTIRVQPEEKEAFISEHRGRGLTIYDPELRTTVPFDIWPAGPRDEYHSIIYLEPLDLRNHAAIGYDMFTHPVRRIAMERARDTGVPAASGKVNLVQEIGPDKQSGFLIYVPVYRGGRTPATVEERRQALAGFVYSPFRAGDLLAGIIGNSSMLEIEIFDGAERTEENQLYRSERQPAGSGSPPLEKTLSMEIAGRTWTLAFTPGPYLNLTSGRIIVPFISVAGFAISAVLFVLSLWQARAHSALQRGAVELRQSQSALLDSEDRLKLALDAGCMAVWEWDLNRREITWTANSHTTEGLASGRGQTDLDDWLRAVHPEDREPLLKAIKESAEQRIDHRIEFRMVRPDGTIVWLEARGRPLVDPASGATRVIGVCADITARKKSEEALRDETRTLEILSRVGPSLLSELNLEKLIQAVTNAATEAIGAAFGAFFYRLQDGDQGFSLYALAGLPRDQFDQLALPSSATVFDQPGGPRVVRIGDLPQHPEYTAAGPRAPEPPLVVRSYLAVPVISRSGEVLGALFFGHAKPDLFSERAERIVLGIAAQAGIAIDNARLFKAAQSELSERRRAEIALRESRQFLQKIADALPVLIAYIDSQQRFLFNNQAFEKWFGIPRRAMAGVHLKQTIGEPAYHHLQPHIETALRGHDVTLEMPVPFPQGTRYLHANFIPHRTELDQVAGLFALVADITDRKQAEDEAQFLADAAKLLSESLQFEETLGRVARLAVPRMADWCVIDMLMPDGQIRRLEIVHSDPAKVEQARAFRERYPVDPWAPRGPAHVIRTGEVEAYFEMPDPTALEKEPGSTKYFELIRQLGLKSALIVPIKTRGRIFGAITLAHAESGRRYTEHDLALAQELALRAGLAIDNALLYRQAQQEIQERNEAQRALQESEERFRLMVERAQDYAIFMMDKEGRISSWNPGAERILGYRESEVIGQPGAVIFTPEDRQRGAPESEIRIALERGQAVDERWHVRKDGSQFWSSGYMIALKDQAGRLRGFAKIMRDMTERKQAEEAIRQLNLELERRVEKRTADLKESNEQMEAFTYTVAHDLRAPLRAMQGFSQALLEDHAPELSPEAQEYILRVVSSAQRMDRLIQDLLTYSRLSRAQITFERISLEQVLDNVTALLDSEIRNKNATIAVERPLPEVIGHAATLEHILSNLVANALKFVAPGVAPQVRIWAEEHDTTVRLWVEDNGIGVAPQYRDRIFRVFERLHGPDAYPGTGIGLAIVRKGIDRMRGQCGLEAAPGGGSRFWIELPK